MKLDLEEGHEEVLAVDDEVGNFTELNDKIQESGDELKLEKNYRYVSGDDIGPNVGLNILKDNYVVNGQNHTIDGNGIARIFNIASNNVTLRNINFVNGYSNQSGGAVTFYKNGSVENCNFINNSASYGGAIYLAEGAESNIEKSAFNGNYADNAGGAIFIVSNATLDACNFTDNHAWSGGALYFQCNGTVKNLIFTNNSANLTGGAVAFEFNGVVNNSVFTNNNAQNGGAVQFYQNGAVDGCVFNGNRAENYGGAIIVDVIGKILNSIFTNNTSRTMNAGAIYSSNNVSVDHCNFTNNSAYQSGGAIQFYVTGYVISSLFISNSARHGGAIDFFEIGEVIDSIFENNHVSESGGAIYGYKINLSGSTFKNNTAQNGGAMGLQDISSVSNSKFFDNRATSNGGAIWINSGDIFNSKFSNNIARNGGAIYYKNNGSVDKSTFEDNRAIGDGGAISLNGGIINNTNLTYNTANNGGAVSASSNLTIANTIFKDNEATYGTDNVLLNKNVKLTLINVFPEDLGSLYVGIVNIINVENVTYGGTVKITVNVTDDASSPLNNGTVSISVNGKTYSDNVSNGVATISIHNLDAGSYTVNVVYVSNTYGAESKEVKFNVFKLATSITASAKSYVINYGGKYSITLKDAKGNVLSGQRVIFTLNGKDIESAITNADGVATIILISNMLKTAKAGGKNLIVKFAGSTNYNEIVKTVKITLKKEKTKIDAKKKTFKKSKRTKKYAITLKNSKGNAIKKVKVTLKVKGKTYTAKTNTKGKATFKIKKLTNEGIFKAVIKFKGNKYFNKATKTVKIKIN